ncbi:hypothetical protein JW823_00825 [bacterium]|nr:hypothetical protein [candidate division CSSED10-310 bacterium]
MVLHPENLFIANPDLPGGRVIVRLFNSGNIERWRRPGAALSNLRRLSSIYPVNPSVDPRQVMWITDNVRSLSDEALTGGSPLIGSIEALDFQYPGIDPLTVGWSYSSNPPEQLRKQGDIARRITMLNLQDQKDSRWRSMGLPVAAQLLTGALESKGHSTCHINVDMHAIAVDVIPPCDFVAIGVYEDFFLETQKWVREIKAKRNVPIILGGPMVTLQPDIVAAHLQSGAAFLKGEAEQTFPSLVRWYPVDPNDNLLTLLHELSNVPGLFAQGEDWWVLGRFDSQPRLTEFMNLEISTRHFLEDNANSGIEYSTSRGCPRSCSFCSHVHGKVLRMYPLDLISNHLSSFRSAIDRREKDGRDVDAYTGINLNDDDLLIDSDRALKILELCREHGFRIWGIQTSIESLASERRRRDFFTKIASRDFFTNMQPLFWIGTDGFTTPRLKRLGKKGTVEQLRKICDDLENFGFRGYHYWIITDADSDWPDFIEELQTLRDFVEQYPKSFHILPNAASLIPYPSTEIYKRRRVERKLDQIVLKKLICLENYPEFDYPLVLHERPLSSYLYALVEPDAKTPERVLTNPRQFLKLIRELRIDEALMEAMRIMMIELEDTDEERRRKELEGLRKRILSGWAFH